ncbi:hypothetical protein C0993_003131, partial [Termitomyces sp. T159_Od127]
VRIKIHDLETTMSSSKSSSSTSIPATSPASKSPPERVCESMPGPGGAYDIIVSGHAPPLLRLGTQTAERLLYEQEQSVREGPYDAPASAGSIPSFVRTHVIAIDTAELLQPDVTAHATFNEFSRGMHGAQSGR